MSLQPRRGPPGPLRDGNHPRRRSVTAKRARALSLQKQKMGRSGPEDAVDGDQRVWALGSRDTRKAGTGERGQSPQWLGISLALNFLSIIVLFVQ